MDDDLFTVSRMKTVAIMIIAFDLFLLVVWLAGAITIIVYLDRAVCFNEQFIVHFLILIHFALGMCIANISDEITKRQDEAKERGRVLRRLPYHNYQPLAWIFTATISFSGDMVLMTTAIRNLLIIGDADECKNVRIAHIAFDAVAVTVSIITILWFIAFSIYSVSKKPTRLLPSGA
jgi:hypothetical protein